MKKLIFILVITFIALGSITSYACSCVERNIYKDWQDYQTILLVKTATSQTIIKGNGNDNPGKIRVEFELLDTYKGNSELVTYIESADTPICCMCDTRIELNQQYIIFSNGTTSDQYLTMCSSSFNVSKANDEFLEVLELVKEGAKPIKIDGVYDQTEFTITYNGKTEQLYLSSVYGSTKKLNVTLAAYRLKSGKLYILNTYSFTDFKE